ncbi:MAG: NADH-quinone oxidoreductase subunit L [Candidatus Bathyarchaeia archaeon]
MLPLAEYAPWLVWLIPLTGSVLVPVIALTNARLRDWFAVVVSFVGAAYSLSMIPQVLELHGVVKDLKVPWIPQIGLEAGVLVDPLSVFMSVVASCIGALIMLYSIGYMAHEEGLTRYYFFMLFFIGGMNGLVMADNFLQLFVFWEIVGLCSYALIGFWYRKESASRAGIKAFIVTKAGDVLLLIGVLMLFIHSGSFNFLNTKIAIEAGKLAVSLLLTSSFLIFGGAIGKSAQFPLQVWLPDAMEGPTTVSALIHAATMVKAGVYLTARTFSLFVGVHEWLLIVIYVGSVTALMTASMALVSTDIKRVLAYSTISQLGLMIAALGVGSEAGWFASQFHVMSHALFKALLFLCAGSVMHAVGTTDMREMGGLRGSMPITFVTSVVGVLALSGVPPFNGFWSKDLIVAVVLHERLYIPLILIFLTSLCTAAYSFRWLALIFFGDGPKHREGMHLHESPTVMTLPLIILAVATTLSGFFEESFSEYLGLEHGLGIQMAPLTLSLLALLIGFLPSYIIYFRGAVSPLSFRRGPLGIIHKLLSEGYYFDHIYYTIFLNGFPKLCGWLYGQIEDRVIDRINYAVAGAAQVLSQSFRPTHTGNLNYNMSAVLLGFVGFFIIVMVLIGW